MSEQAKDKMVIEIPYTFKIEIPQPLLEILGSEEDATMIIHEMFNGLLPSIDYAVSALLYPALIALKSGVADESDLEREVSKIFESVESRELEVDKEGGK